MARARKKAVALESLDGRIYKPLSEARDAFLSHCKSEGLQDSTYRKYRNSINKLHNFCEGRGIDMVNELNIDELDAFRASRKLKAITSSKELQLLRQFCGYCKDRHWMDENAAKNIKSPKNIKPNDVEPFSPLEVAEIIRACDSFGQGPYERLRSRAMILTLRYTALRIGDVAMLEPARISWNGKRWKIFLRTEKNGKMIFLSIPDQMKVALDAVPLPRGVEKESKYYFWNGISSARSMKKMVDKTLRAVFRKSGVQRAHAHRFRHTLATEMLAQRATFEEVADVLGNTPEVVREHYAKWSPARQERIDEIMELVYPHASYTDEPKKVRVN